MDNIQKRLKALIDENATDMTAVSLAIGKNRTYIQQYITKSIPRKLPYEVAVDIADHFNIDVDYLRDPDQIAKEKTVAKPKKKSGMDITEYDVRASAGAGAFNEQEQALGSWSIPNYMLNGRPNNYAVIAVTGDSMEPLLHDGDRVLVDFDDTTPSPPGLFVLFDGMSNIVKKIEFIPYSNPPKIKVHSENKLYSSFELDAEEARIVGRVKLIVRKV